MIILDKIIWTDEEIQILKEKYKYNDVFELSYILKRTRQQIWVKLNNLNLKCKKINRTEYHNLNQVFIDYKRLLNNEIKKFKTDYILEYDILLFKYYLRINNIKITKEFIYNIFFSKLLKDAKLYSRIKKKWHSCFDFISRCFPEMKLKEYNFNTLQVREGFWNKDYNCFDMISNGINSAINDKVINDPSEILLFDLKTIYKYFHKSMIYYRGIGIIKEYLIYKNIKIENINYIDNIRFDSKEEILLYKFLKNYYNIIKNDKILFNNKSGRYKPDFFIYYNDIIIILEYFGMYKNESKYLMFQKYKEKTIDKINYFNSLDGYYFIDLYPTDLKNNFEGIRNKLISFFMSNFNIDLKEAFAI